MKGGLKSLISGVQDLQKEWPGLDVPDGRIHDLVGFLFATLPLAEKELDDGVFWGELPPEKVTKEVINGA